MAQIKIYLWAPAPTHLGELIRYGGMWPDSYFWDRTTKKHGKSAEALGVPKGGQFLLEATTGSVDSWTKAIDETYPAVQVINRAGAVTSDVTGIAAAGPSAGRLMDRTTSTPAALNTGGIPHLNVSYLANSSGPSCPATNDTPPLNPACAMNKVSRVGEIENVEPAGLPVGIQLDADFYDVFDQQWADRARGSVSTWQIDQKCNVRGGNQATETVMVI